MHQTAIFDHPKYEKISKVNFG